MIDYDSIRKKKRERNVRERATVINVLSCPHADLVPHRYIYIVVLCFRLNVIRFKVHSRDIILVIELRS